MKTTILLFLGLISTTLFSQQFPSSDSDLSKELEFVKSNDENLLVIMYSYYSDLTDKYSKHRTLAYEAMESADSYVLGRSKEQKLKDIDKTKEQYNQMNDLYQKSKRSADLYYQFLSKNYPGKYKKTHD